MPKYKPERTGKAPLQFAGKLMAENLGNDNGAQARWYDLCVYQTDGGNYRRRDRLQHPVGRRTSLQSCVPC
jgi:hypothetical protein